MGLQRYLPGDAICSSSRWKIGPATFLAVITDDERVDHHLRLLEGLQLPLPGGVRAPDRQSLVPLCRSAGAYEHDRTAMEGGKEGTILWPQEEKLHRIPGSAYIPHALLENECEVEHPPSSAASVNKVSYL